MGIDKLIFGTVGFAFKAGKAIHKHNKAKKREQAREIEATQKSQKRLAKEINQLEVKLEKEKIREEKKLAQEKKQVEKLLEKEAKEFLIRELNNEKLIFTNRVEKRKKLIELYTRKIFK